MIAGTGSGCGKTTVACALLAAFRDMGKHIAAFKCGPDYIDPMFHKKIIFANSYNLDIFLMGEENVRHALWHHGKNADLCIIEGVMGLYDGVKNTGYSSSNHLAEITNTPVVLVVGTKGKSNSVCAEIYGYINYEKNNICAVILNNTSAAMYPFYKNMIEQNLSVDVIGFMPELPEAQIESRNLGLVSPNEIAGIQNKIAILAENAKLYIDLEKLQAISKKAKPLEIKNDLIQNITPKYSPKIYIAGDEAFCFFYEDNHELLKAFGANLCFFSPLHDKKIPNDADGIILWGGYADLWAKKLADNISMKESIKDKIQNKVPVYAECGGCIYLQESLTNLNGDTYQMAGIINGNAKMTSRLLNFGYAELTANKNNMLCEKNEKINAHSFRYFESENERNAFTAVKKSSGAAYDCIFAEDNIFAGYLYLHFWGNTNFAKRFVEACQKYKNLRGETKK
jgi:cobyrinic acid a,c-diamide synthase